MESQLQAIKNYKEPSTPDKSIRSNAAWQPDKKNNSKKDENKPKNETASTNEMTAAIAKPKFQKKNEKEADSPVKQKPK